MRICCTAKSVRLLRSPLSAVDAPTSYSVSEPAANQDAPINKDSKSPNPRSLKQHTLAESIPLCCFCFCPAREIGRFIILICRYLPHQFNKVLIKILIFVVLYSLPPPSFSCFRIYLSTSTASALKLPAPAMLRQVSGSQPTNLFAMSTDRRNE